MSPLADMLIRIKNAQAVGHEEVAIPFSQMKLAVAHILKNAGYIADVEQKAKKHKEIEHQYIVLRLKYVDGQPALSGSRMISVPSRRMYLKTDEIKLVRSGHGMAILSTPKGVLSSRDARKQRVGGEILCEIW